MSHRRERGELRESALTPLLRTRVNPREIEPEGPLRAPAELRRGSCGPSVCVCGRGEQLGRRPRGVGLKAVTGKRNV